MSGRLREARLVVIRMWRESAQGVRIRIVDRADLPPAHRRTVVIGSVDAGLDEIHRILRSFEGGSDREAQ